MSYVDKHLSPGETVVYVARLHKLMFRHPIGLFLLACIAGLAGVIGGQAITGGVLFLVLAAVGATVFLKVLVLYQTTEMVVTNRRIIYKRGWIRRVTTEINNNMVGGVNVNQSIRERIIRRGAITLTGAGAKDILLMHVANPMRFRRKVMQAVDATQQARQWP